MSSFFLAKGIGDGETELTSFDNALLSSGVANYNLVKVSSILPTDSKECDNINLPQGSVLHTAYATITSNVLGERISAAVGVAIPNSKEEVGVIMEYSGYCSRTQATAMVHEMVREAMRNRGYQIKEIKIVASEANVLCDRFVTAFASISIW